MIIPEHPVKDLYRRLLWGPWRRAMVAAPAAVELYAHGALGQLAASALRARRRLVYERMVGLLGPRDDLWAASAQAFRTHLRNQYVGFSFPKITERTWPRYLRILGQGHLEHALASRRGAVVAHPHQGLPQIPLHALGLQGHQPLQIGGGRPQQALSAEGARVAALRGTLEAALAAELLDGQSFLRPALRALSAGRVVFTACDGTGGGHELGRRVPVDVLGRPFRLPPTAAWLAARADAPLLFLSVWTERGGRVVAEFSPPLPRGDGPETLAALGAHLGRSIAAHPGDWHFWDALHDGPGGLLAPTG